MYRKSYGRSTSGTRPPSRFGRSSSGSGPRSDRSRSYGNSRGGRRVSRAKYIDPSKFINKITITEEVERFIPTHKFQDFNIDPRIKDIISKKGYLLPTPIQDMAIPHILNGLDVVGIANTGTGKTAAFLLPLINAALQNPNNQTLIIAPTRELAVQINAELKGFTTGLKIFSATCYGGAPIGGQIRELRYHNDFVIGTPGRLKDLINKNVLNLSKFNAIVLDEADRMLDMGFVNDMRFIVNLMPKKRQGLFFSATMSLEIEKLIGEFLTDPVKISVKTRDTAKNVEQDIVRIEAGKNKIDVLHELLNKPEFNKVIIFGRTKHGVDKLSRLLTERGFKVESIHGNKNQSRRQKALDLFKKNHVQALIATDVAARGIDIVDVSHVINFDIPETYDDYVHRIGRTGRGDKKGKALTFIE